MEKITLQGALLFVLFANYCYSDQIKDEIRSHVARIRAKNPYKI